MALKINYRKPLLTLCDLNYNQLGIISNKTYKSCYNIKHSKKVNELNTLTFDIPVGGLITKDSSEMLIKFGFDYYSIKSVTIDSGEKDILSVEAEMEATELKGILVSYVDEGLIAVTPEQMYNTVIENCNMTTAIKNKYIFETDIIDTYRSLEMEEEISVYEYLVKIAEQFEACLLISTRADGKIVIKIQAGEYDNKRVIKKGKDLNQLNVNLNTNSICTILTPFGAVDNETGQEINIMEINGGKSYITDYSYFTDVLGMTREEALANPKCNQQCIYRNSNIVDANDLLSLARKELAKISQPVVEATIGLLNLECLEGNNAIIPSLCEKVIISCKNGGYNLSSKIVGIDIDYENPLRTSVTISNVIKYSSTFKKLVETAETFGKVVTTGNGKPILNASKVQGIINTHVAQIKNKLVDGLESQGDKLGIIFSDERVGSPTYGIIALGTSGILFSDQKDSNGEWIFTTAINGHGLSTEVVNAIEINASQIKGNKLSSFDGSTWIDLDNGEFSFKDKIKFINNQFSITLANGNTVENEITSQVNGKVPEIIDTINTTITGGILDKTEISLIHQLLTEFNKEYKVIKSESDNIYNNIYLSETSKKDLKIIFDEYTYNYNALVSKINQIIEDNTVTDIEKSEYNNKVLIYNEKFETLSVALEKYKQEINDSKVSTSIQVSENKITSAMEQTFIKKDDLNTIQAYNVVLSNEHGTIQVDSNNFPLQDGTITTEVQLFRGMEQIYNFTINNISSNNFITVSINNESKIITFSYKKNVKIYEDNGNFDIIISINNGTETLTAKKVFSWITARQGQDGTPGVPGTSQYFHIKYAPNSNPTAEQMTETPQEYIGTYVDSEELDSLNPSKYTWTKFIGQDGNNGTNGLPGTNGVDGKTSYLHIKYSDDMTKFTSNNGETPGIYLGQYVDFVEADSNVFNKYIWAKIKGEKGDNGINGTPGVSSYFHVKYAPNSNPTAEQMTDVPQEYIGTYVDYTKEDSNDPNMYTWYKIMGKDGTSVTINGHVKTENDLPINAEIGEGYMVEATGHLWTYTINGWVDVGKIQGEQGIPGKNGADGKTSYLHIKYSNDGGISFTGNNGEDIGKFIGQYVDFIEADSNSVKDYKWAKFLGEDGLNGTPGVDGTSQYFHIKYSPVATPTDSQMTETPSEYIGTYVDSNPVDSTSASRYTWTKFIGQDGNNGTNGLPGKDGIDGKTSYLHIKYSDDGSSFTSNNGETPGAWLGQYVDFVEADSLTFSKYTWSKIKGKDGINGTPGINGTSQYFHIKYSSVAKPTSSSQMTETPSTYIGTYVDSNPTDSDNPSQYTWTKFIGQDGNNGTDGLPGRDGVDGKTYYLHIKYSNNGSSFTSNNGEDPGAYLGQYVDTVQADSSEFNRYTWSKIRGEDGLNGTNGIDGTSQYFHIKYSSMAKPTNSSQMTETPSEYIGTYVDSNPTDSTDPNKYTWSRFKGQDGNNGTDGLPGRDGVDGKTYYLHIKYSNDGATFTSNNGETPGAYLGQYVDTIQEDSLTFSKYTWSKIRGEDGTSASFVKISSTGQVFSKTATATSYTPNSVTLTPTFTNCSYSNWQYSLDGSKSWTNVVSGQKGLTISGSELIVSNTCSLFTSTITAICFKVLSTNGSTDTMTVIKVTDGTNGTNGTDGLPGANGTSAVSVQLSNESHTFVANSSGNAIANTITINIYGFLGVTQKATSVGNITGIPAGMSINTNNNGSTSTSLTVSVTSSLATRNGVVTIPVTCNGVTINKQFTYSLAVAGTNGLPGTNGTNGTDGKDGVSASYVDITPTSLFFKCPTGSSTYSPNSITLTPTFTNCSYSSWQYSIDGGSTWSNVTNGQNGLTISNNKLVISNTSALYTSSVTSVSFKINASGGKNDIVTIARLKDGNNGTNGTNGANGANGKDSVNIVLSNESHTFVANSDGNAIPSTTHTNILAYVGSTQSVCTVGSISGLPTGMIMEVVDNGTLDVAINITVSSSFNKSSGIVAIPITCGGVTINKNFSYSLAKNGVDSYSVKITSNSQVFKSGDGGTTWKPRIITLTPTFINCSYSKWQYSVNGGSFNDVVSGQNGFGINSSTNALGVPFDSAIFTSNNYTITFKCLSNITNIVDVMSISKLSVLDDEINKITEIAKSEATQTVNGFRNEVSSTYLSKTDAKNTYSLQSTVDQLSTKWEATFVTSGSSNLIKNSCFKNGLANWSKYGSPTCSTGSSDLGFGTALKIVTTANNQMVEQMITGLEIGVKYTLSAYVSSYTICGIQVKNNGVYHSSKWTSSNGNKQWLSVTFTPTTTSVTIQLGRGSWGTSGTHYFTAVKLERGDSRSGWTQNDNEIIEGVTSINQDGIEIKHSDVGTFSRMSASGFSINDSSSGEVLAWLSSKEQWSELKADKIFASNIETIYDGASSLYVNHDYIGDSDGSSSKPFSSFADLSSYLSLTPIINKKVTVNIVTSSEINECLLIENLQGNGYLKFQYANTCVHRTNNSDMWCINMSNISVPLEINGGRASYNTKDGAILCDNGNQHGIRLENCPRFYITSIAINCKNWGVRLDNCQGKTAHIDFCTTWCAFELSNNSMVYDSDACGNCGDFFRVYSGSIFLYGSNGGGYRPYGNKAEYSGKYFLIGSERGETNSFRTPPAIPPTSTHTKSFGCTLLQSYQYAWSNWSTDGSCKQGSWGYGLRGGHMFFDLSSIRSFLSGTVQDGNTITLTRANSGGNSGGSNVYINGSTCSSASGTPSYSNQTYLGTLAWGETKTFNLPKAIVNNLKNGSCNSLAVYVNSTASNNYINIVNCTITLKVNK